MKVAYQGAPGAFGHQAALSFCPGCDLAPLDTFEDVARAVASGDAERGVLPVENSRAGPVDGVAELIATSGVRVVEERALPVRMHLLALPGVAIEDVKLVRSHPVALLQCAEKVAALGLEAEPAANTAVAARDLATRDRAVLASEAAATAYGLSILVADMQDDPDNATRFAVIARK
ncbi:prephenate dehydratase domain-containing protein [Allosphingosinicella deserti]|uniref:prephenate dehydratase domain-containing protein n=1 Tax=Allosphingosinicella deserti TaxID=2116704 RepID=UPI001304FA19|nr:prephenate dehydratase domain-containing protein [Sphingomonas deserti]